MMEKRKLVVFCVVFVLFVVTAFYHWNTKDHNRDLLRNSVNRKLKSGDVGKKSFTSSMLAGEATLDFPIIKHKSKHHIPKATIDNVSYNSTYANNIATAKSIALFDANTSISDNTNSTSSQNRQTTTITPQHKQFFYMYDLEEIYWWRWPANGTDCSENGYVGHEHAQYSGMGPPIVPDDGLFLTWHFSLFSSLYNRMKRSSRRTLDPEQASLFIIPYDLGLDGYLNPDNCRNRRSCSRGMVDKLRATLNKSKYFQRHKGGDHAVLWSLGQYHPWPREQCDVFMKDDCALCTFTCYWMDPTKQDNKFVSVPFPSGYHYHDKIKNLPWDLSLAPHRNLTAVYIGSTQTLNPAHTKIRRAMTVQCNASAECHWLQIAHNSKDTNIADFLSTYKRSVFCLCPPGDDPARKAVFDAIISGCIPVIFEVATIYNQYPWHIGEQNALDISVSIPGGQVRSGTLDFMSVLLAISPEVIRKKQEALAHIAPRVQYAVPPIDSLLDRYETSVWDPPFPDGVEITLDGLFERTGHIVRNESTGIPHRMQTGREWAKEYDVVRVQVPKGISTAMNSTHTSSDAAGAEGSGAALSANATATAATALSESEALDADALQSRQDKDIIASISSKPAGVTSGAEKTDVAGKRGHKSHNGHRQHHGKSDPGGGHHRSKHNTGGHAAQSAFGPPGEEENPALAGGTGDSVE